MREVDEVEWDNTFWGQNKRKFEKKIQRLNVTRTNYKWEWDNFSFLDKQPSIKIQYSF